MEERIRDKKGRVLFTKEMKEKHTFLIPMMLPIHFGIMKHILVNEGYKVELLTNSSRSVVEEGLKYVHNDTCYPATLVIGELMQAVLSGNYDTHKIALVITQTGGGCRASNYLYLLKLIFKGIKK